MGRCRGTISVGVRFFATCHSFAWHVTARAAVERRRGTLPLPIGSVGLAGFSFGLLGTPFRTTFVGRAGFFTPEFGLVTGSPFFRAGFGTGVFLLSATGDGGQPEGGGEGGSEEGAAEVD